MNMTEYRKGRMAYRNADTLTGRESADFDRGYWDEHDLSFDEQETPECLNHSPECEGPVEYRTPMSPSGKSFPRCAHHALVRTNIQRRLSRDYSVPMYY